MESLDKENVSMDAFKHITSRRRRQSSAKRRKSLTPCTNGPTEAIKDMYKTIIQLSSENKINAKNTWNLHLIDHMDELLSSPSKPSNNNDDPEPSTEKVQANGNKAQESNTYNFLKASCTLDASVKIYAHRVDDTYLSSYKILENLSRTDDGETKANPSEQLEKKNTSKKLCVTKTLESNINAITIKSLDLDFQVDPLFHKMSKIFDEGGAKGLLLANLNVNDGCKIVFDSTETSLVTQLPEETEEVISTKLDLRSLNVSSANHLPICPKLQKLYNSIESFKTSDSQKNDVEEEHDDEQVVEGLVNTFKENCVLEDEAEENERQLNSSYVHNFDDECFDMQDDDDDGTIAAADDMYDGSSGNNIISDENQLASQFSKMELMLQESCVNHTEYSYFNPKLLKNWAGPMHWQHLRRKKVMRDDQRSSTRATKAAKSKELKIDFQADIGENAFEIPSSVTSTVLTAAGLKKARDGASKLLLPTDHRVELKDLFSLFTKPHLRVRSSGGNNNNVEAVGVDNDFDDDFGNDDNDFGNDFGNDDFTNDCDGNIDLIDDERKVNKIHVKYETVAKRVDVKKLKENLWSSLEHDSKSDSTTGDNDCEQKLSFESVIESVADDVPSNVTLPFYFICMLHLANEKGLEFEGQSDMLDFSIIKP